MMDDSIIQKYKLAGKITAKARDFGITQVKEGVSYLDVANAIETKVIEAGGGPY